MGLPRALVDRARRVYTREDPNTPWHEGQPHAEEAYGPWFACRFRPQVKNRVDVPDRGGYRYVDETARLLIGNTYEDGTPLVDTDDPTDFIDADDMVEVQSELGTHRFFVNGAPGVLRRRRGVVGYTLEIRRARETEVQEGPLGTVDPGAEADLDQPDDVPQDQVAPQLRGPAAALPQVADDPWAYEGG